MLYGYCRCSTDETKQDIDRQKRELIAQGVPKENIFFEYAHGTDRNRIKLNALLNILTSGDVLVATELSRITRSTKDLIDILEIAKDKHIKIVLGGFVCDCSADSLDPMTEGMLKMMGVFAELERNIISERVKSGLANARAKGKKIGRPVVDETNIPEQFLKYYELYKKHGLSITELAKLVGCSRKSCYKYLRLLGDRL